MTKKTWQEQLLKVASEQLLSNEKLREAVTREVIQTVGRVATKAAGGAAQTGSTAPGARANTQQTGAARGDLPQQLREIWEHPTVQGAVKGGLSTASQQAREWQEGLSGKARERADERLHARLQKRHERGQLSPEEAEQLQQRQREREEQQMIGQLRQGLLAQAANPAQRQVLQRVFESTPWLGGTLGPLRYTQLMSELGGENVQQQLDLYGALWALAEQKTLAVLPHGEIELLPE